MRLSIENKEAIQDLDSDQIKAIQALGEWVNEVMAEDVLKISVSAGEQDDQKLIRTKCQLEGAGRFNRLLMQELQKIRGPERKTE